MHLIVARESNDKAAGFARLTQGTMDYGAWDGVEAPMELPRLYVNESSHGSGIGRAVENQVEGILRESGFRTLWLGVWGDNFWAQKEYEHFGFSKAALHDFVMGNCAPTDWILTKTL